MSETVSSLMKAKELSESFGTFILTEVGGSSNIKEIEENCGSMYITTNDGKVYSVSIMECENE
jgi:hypothetical protein